MSLNITTVLLVAVVGFVGYTLYSKLKTPAIGGSVTGSPNSGVTSGTDVLTSVLNVFNSIAGATQAIAKTMPSTNGGNSGTSI